MSMSTEKIQISLRNRADWSESFLFAMIRSRFAWQVSSPLLNVSVNATRSISGLLITVCYQIPAVSSLGYGKLCVFLVLLTLPRETSFNNDLFHSTYTPQESDNTLLSFNNMASIWITLLWYIRGIIKTCDVLIKAEYFDVQIVFPLLREIRMTACWPLECLLWCIF